MQPLKRLKRKRGKNSFISFYVRTIKQVVIMQAVKFLDNIEG